MTKWGKGGWLRKDHRIKIGLSEEVKGIGIGVEVHCSKRSGKVPPLGAQCSSDADQVKLC